MFGYVRDLPNLERVFDHIFIHSGVKEAIQYTTHPNSY